MVPLQAAGSRLSRRLQRLSHRPLSAAVGVALVLGGLLGHSSLAGAQPVSPAADPSFFPATGYRVSSPGVLDYFQHYGGVRTFGYPVSNEFPLLGKRVQIFQRQLLQIGANGSVTPATILDPDLLPIAHIDGLNLPARDPDMVGSAPSPIDNPDYTTQALSFISVYVPDQWNGLPVNFQSTYLNTVTCADAFGIDSCDPTVLPAMALDIWGLPTSLPTADPLNQDFVYQRFERGIMHYSQATGTTQGLLIGDWLKRVIIGVDLSADIGPEVRNSRLYAQYAPSRPLALDRPDVLPDTSLAQAFRADTLSSAEQSVIGQALPANVAMTATAVALTATAIAGTQVALQGTQTLLNATAQAGTATAVSALLTPTAATMPGASVAPGAALAMPGNPVASDIPVVNVGCMGDEQMWFVPRRPNVGVHVQISVTSMRHHDIHAMALGGPIDPGAPTERLGPLGFTWTWTVVAPTPDAFYQWTFFADGLRPCITSGFNAYIPLGSTATPTSTPGPTNTAGPTNTPTSTVVARPVLNSLTPSFGPCNTLVRAFGSSFGTSQGTVNFVGPSGSLRPSVISWSETEVDWTVPTGTQFGTYQVLISVAGAPASNALAFLVSNSGNPTPTPIPATPVSGGFTPTPATC